MSLLKYSDFALTIDGTERDVDPLQNRLSVFLLVKKCAHDADRAKIKRINQFLLGIHPRFSSNPCR
ncbi:MAG: hypothetical protein N4A61_09775 [Pelagimonas sp.]|jgi:hypothetical protein|nr:hypothetical protein [Pelagimonas sp.]